MPTLLPFRTPTARPRPLLVRTCASVLALGGATLLGTGTRPLFNVPASSSLDLSLKLLLLAFIFVLPGFVAILAAIGYWFQQRWAWHLNSVCIGCALLMFEHVPPVALMSGNDTSALLYVQIGLLALAIVSLLVMARQFQRPSALGIALLGVVLTCTSTLHQSYGPETAISGNHCPGQAKNQCISPLLGAGFPLHYRIDDLRTSTGNRLDTEDDFRLLPFVLDWLFYSMLLVGGIAALRRYCNWRSAGWRRPCADMLPEG